MPKTRIAALAMVIPVIVFLVASAVTFDAAVSMGFTAGDSTGSLGMTKEDVRAYRDASSFSFTLFVMFSFFAAGLLTLEIFQKGTAVPLIWRITTSLFAALLISLAIAALMMFGVGTNELFHLEKFTERVLVQVFR